MKGIKVIHTYNCNMMCGCCEYKCAPYKKGIMSVKEFEERVHGSLKDGFADYICIEGGEPFLNAGMLSKYLRSVSCHSAKKIIKTNGYWGNMEPYLEIINELKREGLNAMIFEYDFYHSLFMDVGIIKSAISKARICGLEVAVKSYFNTRNLSSPEDDKTFGYLKEIKRQYRNIKFIFSEMNESDSKNHGKWNIEEKIIRYKDASV